MNARARRRAAGMCVAAGTLLVASTGRLSAASATDGRLLAFSRAAANQGDGVGATGPPTPERRAPERRVALEVLACGDLNTAVRRAIDIEIGDLLLAVGESVPAGSDHLSISCRGDVALIDVGGAVSPGNASRPFRLHDFPGDAAPRALALAALEALAALSPTVSRRLDARSRAAVSGTATTPTAPPPSKPLPSAPGPHTPLPSAPGPHTPPPPSAAGQPTSPPPAATATSSPEGVGRTVAPVADPGMAPLAISLAVLWRWFPIDGGAATWGGRVALDRTFRPWHLSLDLDVAGQGRTTAAGRVDALLGSIGAFWGLRRGPADRGLVLALGGRAGIARLAGHPTDSANTVGARVLRPWAGPAALARLFVGTGSLLFTMTIEAGFAALGAEGVVNDDTALAVRGMWVATSVGAAIRF